MIKLKTSALGIFCSFDILKVLLKRSNFKKDPFTFWFFEGSHRFFLYAQFPRFWSDIGYFFLLTRAGIMIRNLNDTSSKYHKHQTLALTVLLRHILYLYDTACFQFSSHSTRCRF